MMKLYSVLMVLWLMAATAHGAQPRVNGVEVVQANNGAVTNLTVNGSSEVISTVAGVGGALTNFTLSAGRVFELSAATNVNVVAIMGGTRSRRMQCEVLATNRTATPRLFSVSSVSNNWVAVGDLTFPLQVTNALFIATDVRGSNVYYAVRYAANPAD